MNAVVVKGDAVGATFYYGAGAGAEPTASAVIADLVDIVRMQTADPAHCVPVLSFQPDALADIPILSIEEVEAASYLRLQVIDKPGVLAEITRILADFNISISAMLQKEAVDDGSSVNIIMLTHKNLEKDMNAAIASIEGLSAVSGRVTRIRIEELNATG